MSDIYKGRDPARMMRVMRIASESGFYDGEMEVHTDDLLTTRWLHVRIIRTDGDLAIRLRDVSDSRAHVLELERRANEDALTGLPNRHWVLTYLPDAIAKAQQDNTMLALLFLDLDGFKMVNDTMGHNAGDELLQHAAKRLKVAVRPRDHVARLGGDEFIVIVEHIHQSQDAAHVAERVLHAFHENFKIAQGVPSVGTSIGISLYPDHGNDADTLLKHADIAMYAVKGAGKGNYRFYCEDYYHALRARHDKELELRQAIERDEFVMHYQPRVDIRAGTTSSMEALVRWQHPAKGLLYPSDFISLAEETGLISRLGEMVIDKVCAQVAAWGTASEQLVPVSVNVSPRQFNESNIVETFATALQRHRIDPALIEMELTESSMMGDSYEVDRSLRALQRMGIKLLVDDFGTGYSSLSQLQRLDFDVLKVDRAFTSEVEKTDQGNIFFTAIITMAHALGMRVVAEGVENESQIRILKALRCDEIQGNYISPPLPAGKFQPVMPRWFLKPNVF